MTAAPQTGVKNADDLINLAHAFGLTVTVQPTDRETLTAYVVCISIPVPPAYAASELGRNIAGDTLTLLWTKSRRPGARGRLEDATAWTVDSHRKLRTQQRVTDHIHLLGRQSARYVRETAPQIEDVVDAPHALFIDGARRSTKGVSADFVRTIVRNRRHHGRPIHQDQDSAIVCENRRYVPQPASAVQQPALAVEERQHFRIVDNGAAELISSREALAEINAAMMQPGKRDVRRMSASRSIAHIVYKDGRTVQLRPVDKGQAPERQEQPPTIEELTGPIDDVPLTFFVETYAAVADGMAIPVRADMVRPGMDVIAAVRLEDRTIDTVTVHNPPPGAPFVRVTWTTRSHNDSVMGDAQVYAPDHHLIVTIDSLTRLYGPVYGDGPYLKEKHPAVVAPLFAALAAHEAAEDALFAPSPRGLETLTERLRTLGPAAPGEHHLQLIKAMADGEEAWEFLRAAGDVSGRVDAFGKAQSAANRAKAVILAIEPHAGQMHGTDMPATAGDIRRAARAYNADATREELSGVSTGTPQVRVDCASDSGTGWNVIARITAGVETPQWFIPAHPPVVVKFRRKDGRENAAANARRVFGAMFSVEVPVEYVTDRRP